MTISYPSDIGLPLANKTKQQTPTFTTSKPLSGPAYLQKLSTDAPVIYELSWTLSKVDSEVFRAWVEYNEIYRGVEFSIPLRNEFTYSDSVDDSEIQETQLVRLVSGDIRSCTNDSLGNYQYTGTFRCRKEVTGAEDYYATIANGGSYLLNGREQLDRALNLYSPSND